MPLEGRKIARFRPSPIAIEDEADAFDRLCRHRLRHLPTLSDEFEGVKDFLGRPPFDRDVRDARKDGTSVEIGDVSLKRFLLALRDHLHRPVAKVADESGKAELARFSRREITVHDHLYAAGDDGMEFLHVRGEGFEPPAFPV